MIKDIFQQLVKDTTKFYIEDDEVVDVTDFALKSLDPCDIVYYEATHEMHLYPSTNYGYTVVYKPGEEPDKYTVTSVNCVNCVNCYNCNECRNCSHCKNCNECDFCFECENCDNCHNCETCSNIGERGVHCNLCNNCSNVEACDDCVNCNQCISCICCTNLTRRECCIKVKNDA